MTAKKAAKKTGSPARKPGRPSIFTDEKLEEICDRLCNGEPLAQICRDEGMPAARTVREWVEKHPNISAAIARARESGEEWLAAECLLIAKTPQMGVTIIEKPNEAGELVVVERRTADMTRHREMNIDIRLKLLAKWNPKKWGDKLEHSGNDAAPFVLNITKFSDVAKQKGEE